MTETDQPQDDNTESETFRYTPRDKAALLAVMRLHFPRLKNRSEVLRAAVRLGLPLLAADTALLHSAETPKPEDLTTEAIRERKARERAARAGGAPDEEDSKASDRQREIRDAVDDAKRDRPPKKPKGGKPS